MLVEPVGHTSVRLALERELPQVALLIGPKSVGKMTLALYLSKFHGVLPVDLRVVDSLNMERARDLKHFGSTAPFGKFKLAILSLDKPQNFLESSYEDSLNAILKILEEPPPRLKFILICSTRTLTTVISRSHVFRVGLLSVEEIEKILVDHLNMAPHVAAQAAALSRGQVSTAQNAEVSETAKSAVLTVLKAVSDKDKDLFNQAAKRWSDARDRPLADLVRDYLLCWAREAVTGQWCVFSEADTFGLTRDPSIPKKMLERLYLLPGARSKLVIRVAIESLLTK